MATGVADQAEVATETHGHTQSFTDSARITKQVFINIYFKICATEQIDAA